jgi:hypothetical protein
MTKFVPYLADELIEGEAAALLAEFAQSRGVTVKPPIPVEDIVEKHLKLRFEFDDTHKLFGIPRDPECDADILGAIFLRRSAHRDRREPRSGGEPGEGRSLSFDASP